MKQTMSNSHTRKFDIKTEQRPAAFFTPLHSREPQGGVFIEPFTASSCTLAVRFNWPAYLEELEDLIRCGLTAKVLEDSKNFFES